MSDQTSKVTVHMVSSLDGYIATPDGDISWMQSTDRYENGIVLSDEEITKFLKSIDCYVMGSRTYEHALELGWPYGEVPVVVLTSRNLKSKKKNVSFYSGDLTTLINYQLKSKYKNIWMVGGAAATREFIRLNLVDEINMGVMPVLLGEGTLFFDHIGKEVRLHLKKVNAYKDGMVELNYEIVRG